MFHLPAVHKNYLVLCLADSLQLVWTKLSTVSESMKYEGLIDGGLWLCQEFSFLTNPKLASNDTVAVPPV